MSYTNWSANEYAIESNMQYRQAHELINRIDFNDNDRILDVGCGDGKITANLASMVKSGEVLGIDVTADMVTYAAEKYKDIGNLSFIEMSADALDFPINSITKIVSFSCLHWVKNQKNVWNSFHKMLKNNGQVHVGFQVGHEVFWDVVYKHMQMNQWHKYFQYFNDPYNHFTREEMMNCIESERFFIERFDEIYHVEYFKCYEKLKAFFMSWVPQFRFLPQEVRDNFSDGVLEEYLNSIRPKMRDNAGVRIKRYIIEAHK